MNAQPPPLLLGGITPIAPLGLGCYRMSCRVAEHRAAIRRAIDSGVGLIDTASNYCDGLSEELVGEALSEMGRDRALVMTKAGYISPRLRTELQRLDSTARAAEYSLEPDVLRASLRTSLCRLRSARLDVLLLHNPEHLLDRDEADVEAVLRRAFDFIQEQVNLGTVSVFGVSSNRLSLQPHHGGGAISLPRLVQYAADSGSSDAFRVVEMPCNLLERSSISRTHGTSMSVQEYAAAEGLLTIANRPLNARLADGTVRLALYTTPDRVDLLRAGQDTLEELRSLISAQLHKVEGDYSYDDFPVLRFLRDSWTSVGDPELVEQVFAAQVAPFMEALYSSRVPDPVARVIHRLRDHMREFSLAAISARTVDVLRSLNVDDRERQPGQSFAAFAAAFPLTAGFHHVLVGMRRRQYVDELTPFLVRDRSSVTGLGGCGSV